MTLTVKHNVTTSRANSSAYDISATAWNADHLVTGISNAALDWVSVKDHGAVGDGATDDTVAIQAAIDAAFAASVGTVYMPSGIYKISAPLYLDPPGNLRSNFANPPDANFSMTLTGDEGPGYQSTTIHCTHHVGAGIYVGPGQGMCVRCLAIGSDGSKYRGNWDSTFIAIGACSNPAGPVQSVYEKILIFGFHGGIWTAVNGNGALGETNTFIKVHVFETHLAFNIQESQNFANGFYDCTGQGTIGLQCFNTKSTVVIGGNWSTSDSKSAAFNISGTSLLTATPFGNTFTYTFTTVIASPDIYIPRVYNAFMLQTAHFGVIPCTMTSWDAGTSTATFQILPQWSTAGWGTTNLSNAANTDIQAEIQAVIKVYCSELVTVFKGNSMFITGVDIENVLATTTLIDSSNTFGNNSPNTLLNMYCNAEPTFSTAAPAVGPTDANLAKYLCMQTFPLINISQASDLYMKDCQLFCLHPPVIDIVSGDLEMENVKGLLTANIRQPRSTAASSWVNNIGIGMFEAGVYDRCMTASCGALLVGNSAYQGDAWTNVQQGITRFQGWRPDPRDTPGILAADLQILAGTLPAITNTSVTYPFMFGGLPYRIIDTYQTTFMNNAQPANLYISNHNGFTYGQDITTTVVPGLSWSYKGQSPFLYFGSVAQMNLMKPGLTISINNGITDESYVIMEVHPGLQYAMVNRLINFPFITPLQGNKATVFTGTLIKQEPYDIHDLYSRKYNYQSLGAGFSVTVGNLDTVLIIDGAGVLATGTVIMCPAPIDGQTVTVTGGVTVTALTVSPNTGQSIKNAPTTIAAGSKFIAIYRKANTTWYCGT